MKKMLKLMGFLLFILFFKNSYSQELLPMKKVTLEMETKKTIELKIPENLVPTIKINEKQSYPPKNKNEAKKCLPENKVNIPKTNTIMREEDYDENNK